MEEKNKKKRNIIIIIVAGLLLIGLGTVCLVNVLGGQDRESVGKVESSTEVMVADTEEKSTSATSEQVSTEKATTESKASTEAKQEVTSESEASTKPKDTESVTTESVAAAQQTTQVPSTTQAPSTTAAPSTQAPSTPTITTQATTTTEKEKVWHEPVTEMVWVVDKEAWTETIATTEEIYCKRCHGCQEKFTSSDSFWDHVDAVPGDACGGGWSSDTMEVPGTTEIYHDEEGHWESVVVQEGYWE